MKEANKKKRLQLFDLQRDGKGISKKAPLKESGLKRFFLTYKNNFGKLIYVNMYMVLGNFPLIFLIAVLSGYTKISAYLPASDLFQNLCGMFMLEPVTPSQMSLYALEGLQSSILINTPLSYVFYGLGALTLFTFGFVNVGTAYILRNMAKGEPIFIWADFWYAIKRNWKQALPFGFIDGLISALLAFNLYTTAISVGNPLTSMMFWGTVVLIILYYFMRPYVYIQMVTFSLTVFKMLKNALIFALLGFKRNFMSLLGTLVCLVLEIMFFFALGSLLVPLGVAAPLAILFSTMAYMKVYAAYFKVKEIMIDTYLAEHPELVESYDDVEVIMRDDVTERERLEEIKQRNGIVD
ncbi:MAG: hypothetical protein J6Q85_00085 [Clostridia bacterium]|nr:hypothetical protein [Clostridia bacterium]